MPMTNPVSKEGRVHQQIHIVEYLAEVPSKFPKSAENTPSPSEQIVNIEL